MTVTFSTAVDHVGGDLARLIAKVSRRHRSDADALRDLCVRTGADGAAPSGWYAGMAERYAAKKAAAAASPAAEEVRQTAASFYPKGCAAAAIGEAFESIASMCDVGRIASADMAGFVDHATASSGGAPLTAAALAQLFTDGPLLASQLPPRWWEPVAAAAPRVAQLVAPPTMRIEYRVAAAPRGAASVRHRTLHLEAAFRETGSTAALSRALAQAHGFTGVSEQDFQRYLGKLQRLAKEAKEAPAPAGGAAGDDGGGAGDVPAHAKAAPKAKRAPTVGELYRNPEEAIKNVDLQDADDLTVKEYKSQMDVGFKSNIVRPGDAGYAYDIRKVEAVTAKSEWDDSDED
jgi:centrosomal protein CEP19